MCVVVNHEINDTSRFWAAAQTASAGLPAGLKVIHTFPSPDGRKAVCVWEAVSVEAVRGFPIDPLNQCALSRSRYGSPGLPAADAGRGPPLLHQPRQLERLCYEAAGHRDPCSRRTICGDFLLDTEAETGIITAASGAVSGCGAAPADGASAV